MLWPNESLSAIFSQVKMNSQAVSTLIISSMDIDALCAVEILSEALRSEDVQYTIHAVRGGFTAVDKILSPFLEKSSFKNIFLVNCGGSIDLTSRYAAAFEENEETLLFVLDSHRPIAHQNLLPQSTRVIVMGGEIELDPTVVPTLNLQDLEDDSHFDDEDEEEEEEEEEMDAIGNGDDAPPVKRTKKDRDSKRDEQVALHQQYYAASYLGDPSSHLAFDMVSQSGKETNSLLWKAIVGITSRVVVGHDLDLDTYSAMISKYSQLVLQKNVNVTRYRESVDDGQTRIPNVSALDQTLQFIPKEINLALYRNWSLSDACFHTEEFASQFRVWSSDGQDINLFFARLGLSLSKAEQKFSFLDRKAKALIRQKMENTAQSFQYKGAISIPSFIRRGKGFQEEISCLDTVRVLHSVLWDISPHVLSSDVNETEEDDNQYLLASQLLQLGLEDKKSWNQAVQLCLAQTRLLISECNSAMQANSIQSAGDFRWAHIELHEECEDNLYSERVRFLGTVNGIQLLAKSIIKASMGKWLSRPNGVKPLVLAVSHRGMALVCGLPCPPEFGQVSKNPFGTIFRNTLEMLNIEIDSEEFAQDWIVRMDAQDVQRFLLTLHKA